MSDGLYLAMLLEVESTIDAGAHGCTERVVLSHTQSIELTAFLFLDLICLRIICIFIFPEEPVHAVAHRRADAYILEKLEIWQTDAEIVGHAVLELIKQIHLTKLRGFEVDLVLESSIVSKRNLLVELLLAHSVFLLEWVDGTH